MNEIECLALVVKCVGAFFNDFVYLILLSFLFSINFFIEIASTTLRPVQKLILLFSFLLVLLLFLSPEIVVWMMNSLRQV